MTTKLRVASRDEEKALRRGLVRRALEALEGEIQSQTVFRQEDR